MFVPINYSVQSSPFDIQNMSRLQDIWNHGETYLGITINFITDLLLEIMWMILIPSINLSPINENRYKPWTYETEYLFVILLGLGLLGDQHVYRTVTNYKSQDWLIPCIDYSNINTQRFCHFCMTITLTCAKTAITRWNGHNWCLREGANVLFVDTDDLN